MAREKKITVKPILNQEVKGVQDTPFEEAKYPLYLEITYDRKYTKFPFGDKNRYPLSSLDKISSSEALKSAIRAVEKIIRYEASRNPEFSIKGVAKTIKSYLSPFQACTLMLLIYHLGDELKKHVKVAELENWEKLPTRNKIAEGLKLLNSYDGIDDSLVENLLTTYQLLTAAGFNDIILQWVVYTSLEEKIEFVEKATSAKALEEIPLKEYSVLPTAVKNMSSEELVGAIDSMANLITDNQVSMGVQYVSV